jgi:L-amino acid N-acyltransferase YncA
MVEKVKVIEITEKNFSDYAYCGYKNPKQEGYRRKAAWVKKQLPKGLKFKNLYSEKDGVIGSIEYVPGKHTWRPIEAKGYMVIHCIFIINKRNKGKGYGSRLVKEAIKDAKRQNMDGVAVVTSKGTWMAGKDLFLKLGFTTVDTAPPSFELLVKKFKKQAEDPKFKGKWQKKIAAYPKGLVIIHSDQCPYVAKAMSEIPETAKTQYGKSPRLIELKNSRDAQNAPCGFGIFNIICEGTLVAEHPISNARFRNIMNKEAKKGT